MKFIHCSDIHLDSRMESNLSASQARERNAEICATFGRLVDYAAEQNVTAVLIAGDLFDTARVTAQTVGFVLDRIAGGDATYAVFQIDGTLPGGTVLTLKNEAGETAMECAPVNDFSVLILSGEALVPGTYSFWMGDTQLLGVSGGVSGGPDFFGGMEGNVGPPGDVPGRFEGEPPEGDYEIPPQPQPGGSMTTQGIRPGAGSVQDGTETQTEPTGPFGPGGLAGMNPPDLPAEPIESRPPEGDYELPPQPGGQWQTQDAPEGFRPQSDEAVTEFVIHQGGNLFTVVIPATE